MGSRDKAKCLSYHGCIRSDTGTISAFVILNAVKNLVLYAGVALSQGACWFLGVFCKKGGIWVLRDEILHCVQNDKRGLW
jgi:hypothetical protein